MAIQLELGPEVEARLKAEADERGQAVGVYVEMLIERSLAAMPVKKPRATQAEFRAFLDALTEGAPSAQHLRDEKFSRKMIYDDHD